MKRIRCLDFCSRPAHDLLTTCSRSTQSHLTRTVIALLLCLLWVMPVQAGSLTIGEPGYGGNWHHPAPGFTALATLTYQPGAANATVNYFKININGVDYDASVGPMQNGFTGSVTIPRTLNPQRFVCYAIASVTWTYYQTFTENLDSRNPVSGQAQVGDGKKEEYIYSDIKLKGLKWENRPDDLPIYEHETPSRVADTYPNAAHPFHWQQFRDSNGNPTTTEQHGAVYLMGGAPTLEVTTEPLDNDVEVRAKPKIEFSSGGSGGGGGALPAGYPFNGIAPLTNSVGSMSCPPLKNEVNLYNATVTVNFECKFLDGTWKTIYPRPNDIVSGLRLYTIYAMPGAPMATPAPWEGVLDYSCQWAAGKSTMADVAKEVTRGAYFSKRIAYPNLATTEWWDVDRTTGQGDPLTFRLTDFLNTSGYQAGNCVDISDFLCIAANSQGLGFQVSQYGNLDGSLTQTGFTSNPACLVGGDPNVLLDPNGSSSWSLASWYWHQLCQSQTDAVYDPCAAQKYDLSGNLYGNPPINWILKDYWQTSKPAGWNSTPSGMWKSLGLVEYGGTLSGPPYSVHNPCTPSAVPNPCSPVAYAAFNPLLPASYTPDVK